MTNHCPACEFSIKKIEFTIAEYGYSRCKNCGALFVINNIKLEDIYRSYEKNYFESKEINFKQRQGYDSYFDLQGTLRTSFEEKLKVIDQKIGSGKLLDVGSAYGTFLQIASRQYDCIGTEISRHAANYAKKTYRAIIAINNIEKSSFLHDGFDVITMWDVVEHLRNPITALREVNRLLKPGGYCFISTDDVNNWFVRIWGRYWWSFAPPLHLCHFSTKSLKIAAQRAGGFEICGIKNDRRIYKLNELVKHFGVAYQNKFLQNAGHFLNKKQVGQITLSISRPEQFILILRKQL